jgi:hypothetical protein
MLMVTLMIIPPTTLGVRPLSLKSCSRTSSVSKLLLTSLEEKLGKIDILAYKVDSLDLDVELLKLKVLPNDVKESNTFAATNAI